MDATPLDAQFNRAVEIVQGLPNTGPIQTGYEEKLAMYSLYKQATVGDVTGQRPGMWDMLGRAKWDAWEKQRGLDQQQAKYLYVETLQKVLRKYSDKTVAKDLAQELDSYIIETTGMLMGSQSDDSSSSRSASPVDLAKVNRRSQQFIQANQLQQLQQLLAANQEEAEEEQIPEEENDVVPPTTAGAPLLARPHSAVSSHMRYRTPLATTAGFSPTSAPSILPTPPGPPIQPMPRHATPSAFSQPHPGPLPPPPSSSASYPTSLSYAPQMQSPSIGRHGYHGGSLSYARSSTASESTPGLSRQPLERAVESLQTTLAALHERMDALEAYLHTSRTPHSSYPGRGGSPSTSSPFHHSAALSASLPFDPSQTGAWSILLKPLYQAFLRIQQLSLFLFHPPNPSTATARLIIIRRLLLDTSFAVFVLMVIRTIWRATGIRRKEVFRALLGVWHAIVGSHNRVLVDKGV
ncbi:hypothetical protein FRC02_002851 [Tulasnella sp. 418]|nr:hypothetical protein FRC02_002851 [Tulasnella sp. 418]